MSKAKGLRAVQVSLSFKMLGDFSAQKTAENRMVGPPRFERGTCRL